MQSDLIYAIAVDFNPLKWVVQCEICDDIVIDETTDVHQADLFEYDHRKVHNQWEGWEESSEDEE